MIRLFRGIRQKLLSKNKFGKYLIYAIGEVVLVMIGVLLALQVNNWNERNKKRALEINILRNLKNDVKENVNNLELGIKVLENYDLHTSEVILAYEEKKPYDGHLLIAYSEFIGWWNPDFTYASFENFKNAGVNIISNSNLRKDIVSHIELDMNILDIAETERMNQINHVMILPLKKKYFHRDLNDDHYRLVPTNYDTMINDPEFYNVCTELSFKQKSSIIRYRRFNKKAKDLISRINAEINKLEK